MIRRVFAMLFALTFWSIQTADAAVLHVNSDAAAISVPADHAQVSVDADSDESKSEQNGQGTCTNGCPCHIFHSALPVVLAGETDLRLVAGGYSYSQDACPDHLSAPLNRPPLS